MSSRVTGSSFKAKLIRDIEQFGLDFRDTRDLAFSVNVEAGFRYWWILEYGSSPAVYNPGPKPGDAVPLQRPFNLPAGKHHIDEYLIRAHRSATRWNHGRSVGQLRPPGKPPLLKFYLGGQKILTGSVHHPGIRALGWIRVALLAARRGIKADLERLARGKTLPRRAQIVALINRRARIALQVIRGNAPVEAPREGEEVDGEHLRDQFFLTLAK